MAVPVAPPETRVSSRYLDAASTTRSPFGRFHYTDVVFEFADVETAIPHTLKAPDSNAVRYLVVRKDRAGDVYENYLPSRREWKPGLIYLKCNTAGAQVRLMLFTERFVDD